MPLLRACAGGCNKRRMEVPAGTPKAVNRGTPGRGCGNPEHDAPCKSGWDVENQDPLDFEDTGWMTRTFQRGPIFLPAKT